MFLTPWVLRLLVANVIVFFLTMASPHLASTLALVPAYLRYRPWTLVTYMFVHAGYLHIIFNMIVLYFFGPRLEQRLGGRHFLALYFLSGIAGGVLTFFLTPYVMVVGASGAVMGVTAAYARYWPHDRIYIWGILPVSAWLMVAALAAYSIYSGFTGSRGGIADWAHLGGLAVGLLYAVAYDHQRRKAWPLARKPSRPSRGETRAQTERWSRIQTDHLHEVNRPEVERLLAKVHDHGPAALTPAERDFLDRFSPP